MRNTFDMMLAPAMFLWAAGVIFNPESVYAGEKKQLGQAGPFGMVTIDQAVKAATEKTAGKVIAAELGKNNGKVIWGVKTIGADGKVTETHIDAESGVVIEITVKK